jgi:hypothetical protein
MRCKRTSRLGMVGVLGSAEEGVALVFKSVGLVGERFCEGWRVTFGAGNVRFTAHPLLCNLSR